MRPFEISDEGTAYVAALSTPERLVLAQVTGDVVELLGGEDTDVDLDEADGEADVDRVDREDTEDGVEIGATPLDQGAPPTESHTAPLDGAKPLDGAVPHDAPDDAGASARTPATAGDSLGPGAQDADPDDHLRQILDGIDADVVVAPADPAVRRLLPDASDDPEVAHEFRRLTDDDLRQRKVDRLLLFADLLLEASPSADEDEQLPLVVGREEGAEIAGALGDVRQVIGSRLGLQTDADTDALYRSVSATWEEDEGDGPETGQESARGHAGEALSGPELFLGSVFLLTGYLQESLTDCLLEHHRRAGRAS
ncbi:DUF2017 family protein [Sanguibacter sp. Leaf3]|uniref:DUF2017 family protein n=1 Tax=Sanguibacter sp. Leaf3 TaxID=1736209 RepID=UPI0006F6ED63|nr:DUF2017 family protein [Sanguibacter sp. Leaf3]KQU00357.1 hypothetical protein ASG53_05895 [Sanguibacter sp. Leaf3]